MNTIQGIYEKFTDGVADIEVFQKTVVSATDGEYSRLLKQKESYGLQGGRFPISGSNMFFQEATSGNPVFYGYREINADDAIVNLLRQTNRQHQWFLVEAYELFEEFLKHAYAYMGMNNPSRWPLRDFDSIQWGEIPSKNYQWFLKQAQVKQGGALAMLRQFSKALPRMASVECNNRYECDLKVAVTLLGEMRHVIVHAKGIVADKKKFAQKILGKMGYSGAGMESHMNFIERNLLLDSEDGSIFIMNVPGRNSTKMVSYHYNILIGLIRYLLIYAHEICISLGGMLVDGGEVASRDSQ